jgi:6-pyruvoyl-tetrahydropterin synthase
MSINFQHLLTKHGVLSDFIIAKKIKQSYVKSLEKRLKNSGKNEKEIEEEINKKIIINTQKFIDKNEIPGLHPTTQEHKLDLGISDATRKKIVFIANKTGDYLKKHKFSKECVIFFMQIILHYMNVTNDDVHRFKEKYNINNEDDGDYLDNEDDEF